MHGIGRFAPDEQVYMVRHDLQLDEVGAAFVAHLADDGLESVVDGVGENGTPVLGAPHDVVVAAIDDVAVTPGRVHPCSMLLGDV